MSHSGEGFGSNYRPHFTWERAVRAVGKVGKRRLSRLYRGDFETKKAFCVVVSSLFKTNRFHVTVRLFSNRSQTTSNCGKNISGTLSYRRLLLLTPSVISSPSPGVCNLATTPYSCHGVYTDRSNFSLNLSRIQIPTGTSVTNCNHKHGLMSTCRHDMRLHCFILTEACSCRLELALPAYFAGKISKNILVCKNAVALA